MPYKTKQMFPVIPGLKQRRKYFPAQLIFYFQRFQIINKFRKLLFDRRFDILTYCVQTVGKSQPIIKCLHFIHIVRQNFRMVHSIEASQQTCRTGFRIAQPFKIKFDVLFRESFHCLMLDVRQQIQIRPTLIRQKIRLQVPAQIVNTVCCIG